jgi:serine/threonine-protein kinase
MSPARTVYLLRQLCLSLRDAHVNGLIHRDVKPANVFVCKRGGECDFVKLLDFGLVRQIEVDDASSRLTVDGAVSGTPAYMAPEVTRGEAVDARMDLYAVGCIAYRMLAGRNVFDGTSVYAVMYQHATEPPTPLGEIAPDVPPELAAVVMKCLAKAPSGRFDSADALIAALDAVPLADHWTQDDAQKFWAATGGVARAIDAVAPTVVAARANADAPATLAE